MASAHQRGAPEQSRLRANPVVLLIESDALRIGAANKANSFARMSRMDAETSSSSRWMAALRSHLDGTGTCCRRAPDTYEKRIKGRYSMIKRYRKIARGGQEAKGNRVQHRHVRPGSCQVRGPGSAAPRGRPTSRRGEEEIRAAVRQSVRSAPCEETTKRGGSWIYCTAVFGVLNHASSPPASGQARVLPGLHAFHVGPPPRTGPFAICTLYSMPRRGTYGPRRPWTQRLVGVCSPTFQGKFRPDQLALSMAATFHAGSRKGRSERVRNGRNRTDEGLFASIASIRGPQICLGRRTATRRSSLPSRLLTFEHGVFLRTTGATG